MHEVLFYPNKKRMFPLEDFEREVLQSMFLAHYDKHLGRNLCLTKAINEPIKSFYLCWKWAFCKKDVYHCDVDDWPCLWKKQFPLLSTMYNIVMSMNTWKLVFIVRIPRYMYIHNPRLSLEGKPIWHFEVCLFCLQTEPLLCTVFYKVLFSHNFHLTWM